NDPIINNNDENTIAQEKLINQDLVTSNLTALQSQLPIALQHFITDSATDLVAPALQHLTASSNLKNAAQGRIYIDPRPVAAISSTQVRQQLRKQGSQNATLQPINAIINPTVPNSFAKWLNPAVYQYIIDHQLYSAAQFR
ncbi:MAG: nicotinate-nicotinamide nucleotide adenylyltransferase, partial [Psychrobacter faecalis]